MPTFRRFHDRSSAFTLIELLVIISIIALLIAILLPALSMARDSARTVMCSSNLRQVGLAFVMYRDDYKEFLPYIEGPNYQIWTTGYLAPYVGLRGPQNQTEAREYASQGVFECPGDPTDFGNIYASTGGLPIYQPSYGMNYRLAGRHVEQRSETIHQMVAADSGHTWEGGVSSFMLRDDLAGAYVYPRHGSGQVANLLFVAGHVLTHFDMPAVNAAGSKLWSYYNFNKHPALP